MICDIPHRYLRRPLQALEMAVLPGKDACHEGRLRTWARRIETWAAKLNAVYVHFANHQAGYPAANALTLKSMVFGMRMKKVA